MIYWWLYEAFDQLVASSRVGLLVIESEKNNPSNWEFPQVSCICISGSSPR